MTGPISRGPKPDPQPVDVAWLDSISSTKAREPAPTMGSEGTATDGRGPMTPIPDGVPPAVWVLFEDYGIDEAVNRPAEAARMITVLLAQARANGAAEVWSRYSRQYEDVVEKMPRWDEDKVVIANSWAPGRCGNCGEAIAPDIAAAARPPVCADGCQLAGWLAESAQQATEPSAPSRPGEEDRLRARRDRLLAAVEERVRRECAEELESARQEARMAQARGRAPVMYFALFGYLVQKWRSGSGRTPAGEQG